MKQVLLYSLLLSSLLLGFVACSSDDVEIMGPALADVNGDYQNGSGSKALEIYYSDNILSGSDKTVVFNSEDKQTAILTLKNVIPGMDLLELPEVLLTSSKDQTQFTFSGTCTKTDCIVSYDGAVEKGKMSLSLSVKLAANDDVVGQWILQKIQKEGEAYKKQSVFFTWITTDEFPGFKIKTADGYNLTLSCSEVAKNLGEGFSEYMASTDLLRELTFYPDGNAVALYKVGDSWQKSKINDLQYYINNDHLYLLINENLLKNAGNDNGLMFVIKPLLEQYSDGFPLNLITSESGKMKLYLDSRVLASQTMLSMASFIRTILPTQSDYFSVSLLQNIFDNYAAAIKATTKMELGLNFSKVE